MPTPTRVLLAALAVLLVASPVLTAAQDDTLTTVSAKRYIVVDAETGETFAAKDADIRGGMASLTKIFTIMEAIERAPLDTQITAKESDLFGPDSTSMTGFAAGVTFTLDDLLHGMMLESGNDAAVAVARSLGAQEGDTDQESVDRFVGWMNERVASLGLKDTRLKNPHGLSEDGHYTTPHDLAAFLMYASTNDDFMRILTDRTYTTSTGVELASINRGPEFIPDYIGGKTGFDEETGYCLAEFADRGGEEMIAVTIDGVAPETWYVDHASLFDVAFTALDARVAAHAPLPASRVSYVVPGQQVTTADSSAGPSDQPVTGEKVDVAVADQPAQQAPVPAAVRVDALPQPVIVASPRRSITGNWVVSMAVAAGLMALIALRRVGSMPVLVPPRSPVDTSGSAS